MAWLDIGDADVHGDLFAEAMTFVVYGGSSAASTGVGGRSLAHRHFFEHSLGADPFAAEVDRLRRLEQFIPGSVASGVRRVSCSQQGMHR